MQIYLSGGPCGGDRIDTDEPFVEGDKVVWTPEGDVSLMAGPFSAGGYIINETDAQVDGVRRRTAIWRD